MSVSEPVSPEPTGEGSILASLTPEQRAAALALTGPVVIRAGAGTGKTRTITHRIAYGIRSGVYDPGSILALTFTTRAAGELRLRLRALGTGTVTARTFHAAALSQLSYFWPHAIGGERPTVLPGKGDAIAQAAERIRIRTTPQAVRELAAEIEWRKVTEHSIADYASVAATERPTPSGLSFEQTVDVMQAYEDIKDERRQLDFEDVLLATVGMLEMEPWVTQRVREQYRFFVVDEFQDVSPLQEHLLRTWMGDRRDLCVVGDPAQTIYSFTGATSRYLNGFSHTFPEARAFELTGSFRSTPAILHEANDLSRSIPNALTLVPGGDRVSVFRPDIREEADDATEANSIAAAVRRDLDEGVPPGEIAVLTRIVAQQSSVRQALEHSGIPIAPAGGKRFFNDPNVRLAMAQIHAQALVPDESRPLFQTVSDALRAVGWTQSPPVEGPLRDRWQALDALIHLAESRPADVGIREFDAELRERAAAGLEPDLQAVVVTTLHAVKGLEWESVHIPGLHEGLMPISHATADDEVLEERRLLYVGITRAKTRLRLSWARSATPGGPERSPSRFLAELGTRSGH